MTKESNKPVQRHDRDLCEGIVPGQDSRDEKLQKLKEYLSRTIKASEANGKVPLHGDALRRHADLDRAPEHPYAKLVREHREAKNA